MSCQASSTRAADQAWLEIDLEKKNRLTIYIFKNIYLDMFGSKKTKNPIKILKLIILEAADQILAASKARSSRRAFPQAKAALKMPRSIFLPKERAAIAADFSTGKKQSMSHKDYYASLMG